MIESVPYLVKKEDTQVQEVQRVSKNTNPKRYIIIKMAKVKDKERILKAA